MKLLPSLLAAALIAASFLPAEEPQRQPTHEPPVKLLIAFSSYRERPKHPNVFFYEHDGVSQGKIVGSVGTPRPVASAHGNPSLTHDGRLCAYTFEMENEIGQVHLWDRKENKPAEKPGFHTSPNAQMA